ncbi:MAG: Class-II synthetase family, partial [Pseudomonadota bacterium]
NYQSYCDPRLNYGQSLELMLRFCDAFKKLAHREVGSAVGSLQMRSNESSVEECLD